MGSDTTFITALLLVHGLVVLRAVVDIVSARVPSATAWWFGITFATLIPANALLWLDTSTPASVSDLAFALSLLPVIVYPRALFGFACSLCPTPRWLSLAATASTVVIAIWLLLVIDQITIDGARRPAVSVLIGVESLQWLVLSIASIVLLVRTSAGTPALVRARLQSIALGIVFLVIANIVRSTRGGEDLVPAWATVTIAGTILAFIGYSPPATIRSRWSRRDRSSLRKAIADVLRVERPELVGPALLPAASRLVGGHGVALVAGDGSVQSASGIPDVTAQDAAAHARAIRTEPEELVFVESIACVAFGDETLLVAVSPATPAFGEEELELLLTVVTTANLAMTRLQAVDRLRSREAELVEAQRLSRLAAWTWDPALERVLPDPQLDRMLGADRDEIERAIANAIAAPQTTDGMIEFDVEVAGTDHRSFHVRSAPSAADANSGPARGTVQDVTDRVAAERALRDAVEREREAADELRRLGRLKDDILIAVSHELRTPLTTILGLTTTLQDHAVELDEQQRAQMLDHVVAGAQRLDRLLVDLLDLDRVRRGTAIDRVETDLAALVRTTIDDLALDDGAVTLELEHGIAPVDPVKVGRIVENLVGNARKYAPSDEPIVVKLELGDTIGITVLDRGPGVPVDEQRSIFEPFTRASNSGSMPGSGVGLSLVAEFARVHGGRAWIEDRPGGGSAFHVELATRPT